MKLIFRVRLISFVIFFAVLPSFAAPQSDVTPGPDTPTVIQKQQIAAADTSPNAPDDPQSQTESSSGQAADRSNRSDNAVDHHILSNFVHDEYHMWTGPFHPSNYDSHTMKKYGLPFIVISGALITTDRYTAKWLPNTRSQVIWSGRVSQIGSSYSLIGISGGTYLIGRFFHNDHAKETGFLALEAAAHSQLFVLVFKEVTQRTRPIDTTHGTGWWGGGVSFPSGHAIGSFAVASVFAYEYHDHIAVPITAYSLATLVALSRMGAREHWVSDLFVGSSMGFMIGRHIYKEHHDPELPGSLPVRRSVSARLRPAFDFGANGPGLYWNF